MEWSRYWGKQMPFSFNVLLVGKADGSGTANIVFGTTKGKIRIFQDSKEAKVLETKGGAIQAIILQDVTNFGTASGLDLIVGDVEGNVVIFSHNEIYKRSCITHPVTALVAQKDAGQNCTIIVGDFRGVLHGYQPNHEVKWRVQVYDSQSLASIRCLHSLTIPNKDGLPYSYTLVSESSAPALHFYSEEVLVRSLPLESKVNAICSGYFLDGGASPEIAVACEDGYLHIVRDYQVERRIKVGVAVTALAPLPISEQAHPVPSSSSACSPILCCGHFNGIKVFYRGELLSEYETNDWVHTVGIGDVDGDGQPEVVLGLLDNNVICLKYAFVARQKGTQVDT